MAAWNLLWQLEGFGVMANEKVDIDQLKEEIGKKNGSASQVGRTKIWDCRCPENTRVKVGGNLKGYGWRRFEGTTRVSASSKEKNWTKKLTINSGNQGTRGG